MESNIGKSGKESARSKLQTMSQSLTKYIAKGRKEPSLFVSAGLDSNPVDNDQFSISAHSSDSANVHNEHMARGQMFRNRHNADGDDQHSERSKHDDVYSINAEESKSDQGSQQNEGK